MTQKKQIREIKGNQIPLWKKHLGDNEFPGKMRA
jgi:hypothetical protein